MSSKPWSDHDPGWPDHVIEDFADDDEDFEEKKESLRRTKWLQEEASIEQVFEHAMPDCVTLDDDTVKSDGYYVWTPYKHKPGAIDFGMDNDELGPLDWNLSIRWSIDQSTDYRITNTRLKNGQFVVTLAPEEA